MKQDLIVILDLGCTENTVLAREIRELGGYSEIHPHDITEEEINFINNYDSQYIERLNIYASNRDMFDRYFENDNVNTF